MVRLVSVSEFENSEQTTWRGHGVASAAGRPRAVGDAASVLSERVEWFLFELAFGWIVQWLEP